jgi:predicted phage gp36 major capsid-like protein
MTVGSDPDGGYLVPFEMEAAIDRVLMNVSAMRNLAQVISISGGTYKKQVSLGGATSGWVGETEAPGDLHADAGRTGVHPRRDLRQAPARASSCWTTPAWTWRPGWPTRFRSPSPNRKAPPS